MNLLKKPLFTGTWGNNHIQGIAVDYEKGYIYYSFTTKLVKATLRGELIGCVDGLLGHLGCISFHQEDGCVYGSLEYKNDVIGKGILKRLGSEEQVEDAFYMAIFDVDRIVRMDMDAEKDGIMTVVFLEEVVNDYHGSGKNKDGETVPHRYGCSGIDGTAFGPLFGQPDSGNYLYVAYGIYSDLNREDNDHQVLLCYDVSNWKDYAGPFNQKNLHRKGPKKPFQKLFLDTGNTTFGVQNLEYDALVGGFWMAVYPGKKPEYPNYELFLADAGKAPVFGKLRGIDEEGLKISLKPDMPGWRFPFGSTGLYASGDGTYLISEPHTAESGKCSYIYEYCYCEGVPFVLKG